MRPGGATPVTRADWALGPGSLVPRRGTGGRSEESRPSKSRESRRECRHRFDTWGKLGADLRNAYVLSLQILQILSQQQVLNRQPGQVLAHNSYFY